MQGTRMSGRSTPLTGYPEQYRMEGKKGWLAAFGTAGYPDEPPLLEELGVNFGHIKKKTLTVLNPLKSVDQHIMDDTDLAGPILFCLLFATFLLLGGKSHFGYVYGFILLGTISLHLILNLMSQTGVNFLRTASVLGYCLLPLVLTSAIGVVLSLKY
jgi:protein YIPF5/7